MSLVVDYYLTPASPWSYLGHDRFIAMARAAKATVNLFPVDLGGKIFPVSGGLPLAKRAPQRQAYRLVELDRFARFTGMKIVAEPKFFPVSPEDAARLVITVNERDGNDAALALTREAMRAVWVEERNIADPMELAAMLQTIGLAPSRLDESKDPAVHERYLAHAQRAIDAGVFGAPSYVIDGEIFWGQDRLDFVQRRLAAG